MILYFVSKRYTTFLFFVLQVISTSSFADNERISIFGWVSLAAPREPGYSEKYDNLGALSAHTKAKLSEFMDSQDADSEMEKLAAVNSWVNENVEFTLESDDEWSNANQTLARGTGDCEDHAVTKMQLLRRVGFAEDQILFMIVYDLPLRQYHAILAVRIGGEYYVLDNVTNMLLPHSEFSSSFRPYYAIRGKQAWTFGKLVSKYF